MLKYLGSEPVETPVDEKKKAQLPFQSMEVPKVELRPDISGMWMDSYTKTCGIRGQTCYNRRAENFVKLCRMGRFISSI